MPPKQHGSKPCEFSKADAVKVLRGALVAAAGAALTYLAEWVAGTDFGDWTPVVVAGAGIAVNALRKLLTDTTKG